MKRNRTCDDDDCRTTNDVPNVFGRHMSCVQHRTRATRTVRRTNGSCRQNISHARRFLSNQQLRTKRVKSKTSNTLTTMSSHQTCNVTDKHQRWCHKSHINAHIKSVSKQGSCLRPTWECGCVVLNLSWTDWMKSEWIRDKIVPKVMALLRFRLRNTKSQIEDKSASKGGILRVHAYVTPSITNALAENKLAVVHALAF